MAEKATNPQLRLFEDENPLKTRFDGDFFKQIPCTPGVYWMLGSRGEILYVGKAKSLRARLRSYRNTSLSRHPSKVQRLLKRVQQIHWDEQPSEEMALLRENEFLRAIKPPFNVTGTKHETYLFFGFRELEEGLEIRLLFDLRDLPAGFKTFGAFKGISRVRRTHAAILRWLWTRAHGSCSWPVRYARQAAPLTSIIPWSKEDSSDSLGTAKASSEVSSETRQDILTRLELFLSGYWPLEELVLPEDEPSRFLQCLWRDDQISLETFYRNKTEPQRLLRAQLGLGQEPIPQERVDDLIVVRRFQEFRSPDTFLPASSLAAPSDFLVLPLVPEPT